MDTNNKNRQPGSMNLIEVARDFRISTGELVDYLKSHEYYIDDFENYVLTEDQYIPALIELKMKIGRKGSEGTRMVMGSHRIPENNFPTYIGFKNFRRFTNFNPIKTNGITFLVGRNNAGKSTLVKALLLTNEYLKSDSLLDFSFQPNNVEDANIVTFDRALNQEAQKNKQEYIRFTLERNGYTFNILVSGAPDSTRGSVYQLIIDDQQAGFSFDIKPQQENVSISILGDKNAPTESDQTLISLKNRKAEIQILLEKIADKKSREYIDINSELKKVENSIDAIKSPKQNNETRFSLETHFTEDDLKSILQEALDIFLAEYDVQYAMVQQGKKAKKNFATYTAFKENEKKLKASIHNLGNARKNTRIVYLGASLNKQSALFAIRDKSNPLAQAIHDFVEMGIYQNQGSDAFLFVKKWMGPDNFDIGDSLEINMHAGEAYEVNVISKGVKTPLADLGMGSIQSILLILRLAIVIRSVYFRSYQIIVIEEPELNLHPAFQSKLADLFHEVYENHGIEMIIETHSEYLIRKSQLIVKEKEYEIEPNENPFSVIYFDKDLKQWTMSYRKDGKFSNSFGNGFYDEASKLTLNLL